MKRSENYSYRCLLLDRWDLVLLMQFLFFFWTEIWCSLQLGWSNRCNLISLSPDPDPCLSLVVVLVYLKYCCWLEGNFLLVLLANDKDFTRRILSQRNWNNIVWIFFFIKALNCWLNVSVCLKWVCRMGLQLRRERRFFDQYSEKRKEELGINRLLVQEFEVRMLCFSHPLSILDSKGT